MLCRDVDRMEPCMARLRRSLWTLLFAALALASSESAALAQQGAKPPASSELSDRCPGLVAARVPRVLPAALRLAALADGEVRLTYVGHSTFLIESPRLV